MIGTVALPLSRVPPANHDDCTVPKREARPLQPAQIILVPGKLPMATMMEVSIRIRWSFNVHEKVGSAHCSFPAMVLA